MPSLLASYLGIYFIVLSRPIEGQEGQRYPSSSVPVSNFFLPFRPEASLLCQSSLPMKIFCSLDVVLWGFSCCSWIAYHRNKSTASCRGLCSPWAKSSSGTVHRKTARTPWNRICPKAQTKWIKRSQTIQIWFQCKHRPIYPFMGRQQAYVSLATCRFWTHICIHS